MLGQLRPLLTLRRMLRVWRLSLHMMRFPGYLRAAQGDIEQGGEVAKDRFQHAMPGVVIQGGGASAEPQDYGALGSSLAS